MSDSNAPVTARQVPKVRWDLTTPRVLTMEYCDGGQVNDPDYLRRHRIAPREVSQKLGKLYSEMIFERGCVARSRLMRMGVRK